MSTIAEEKDPLASVGAPDRVFYALGALLGVDDFLAEQTYHRGRLARALAFLDGSGTVAGLLVEYKGPKGPEEEIVVRAGLALDRLGRMIEVPRDACIRLDRWYQAQTQTHLQEGLHPALGGVVVDVFIRFRPCTREKKPAFATGPFDATDYATPSRVRDGYALELVIRTEDEPPRPQSPWPDLGAEPDTEKRRAALHAAILGMWTASAHQRSDEGLVPLAEHTRLQDPSSVFLARLVIPAAAGDPPLRTAGDVIVDNDIRGFVYTPGAIARWLGI